MILNVFEVQNFDDNAVLLFWKTKIIKKLIISQFYKNIYLKKYAKNPQQKTKNSIHKVAKTSAGSLSSDEQCVNDSS